VKTLAMNEAASQAEGTVMVKGLSHMTFIVADLDKMERLLSTILGAKKVYDSGSDTFSLSKERFFLVGQENGNPDAPAPIWVAIMEGEPLERRTYNHVAFVISEDQYEFALQQIKLIGLDVREGRSRVPGEGRSIYFHDHDNHLFELHTGTLTERLARYAEGR
jgi:catechol 2,3-dioxygenase-like lactoylglutathione lyase family enzyme